MAARDERIPEGWKNVSLLECGDILQGLTYRPENVKPYGLLVLRSSNIQNGKLAFDDCVFVDCDIQERQYVRKGDIIICVRNGSSDLIGKCALIDANYKATLGAFMAVFRGENTTYIFQVFCSSIVQKQIRNNSNATINQITKQDFKNIFIPMPNDSSEQHAIAEALSDMDGYIASLEKLIAKKKAVKQGAMQELLTGKRRLPGFTGEWEEQVLSRISENITMGQSPSSKYYNSEGNGLPLIQGNADIDNRKTIIRIYTSQITKEAIKGDIILTVRAPVGNIAKATFNCCLGRGVCAISSNNDYLYHWFIYFEPKWNSLSSGSTFDSINGDELRKITLNIPPDETEQSAIAAVLSDMDAEIEALTAKLNKAKRIKQGMMQELLTGRIRLVNVSPMQGEFTISEYMVILAIITKLFTDTGDNGMKFLKHMRYQKLVYLYLVYKKVKTCIFKKLDYGPFSKELAYTVVPKAENEKSYIATDNDKNICVGKNINEAVENAINKGYYKDAEQLAGRIRYKKDTELEVIATVIESIKDLEISQKTVSLQTVKEYISSIPVWRHKLSLEYFTDFAIDKSIKEYYDFFK